MTTTSNKQEEHKPTPAKRPNVGLILFGVTSVYLLFVGAIVITILLHFDTLSSNIFNLIIVIFSVALFILLVITLMILDYCNEWTEENRTDTRYKNLFKPLDVNKIFEREPFMKYPTTTEEKTNP